MSFGIVGQSLPLSANGVVDSNVDRLFAIWQALYPNNYVTPLANEYGTFTELVAFVETADSRMFFSIE